MSPSWQQMISLRLHRKDEPEGCLPREPVGNLPAQDSQNSQKQGISLWRQSLAPLGEKPEQSRMKNWEK